MKKTFSFYFALWFTKAMRQFMRLLGKNAAHLPGKFAIKICPKFLAMMDKPKHTIGVTGTNGKTTVSNLLVDMLMAQGYAVTNNRLGSNMKEGVASALIANSTLGGKSKNDYAVLEIDERSSMHIYPYIKPEYVICTNLFRDSILRNGSPEYIQSIVTAHMQKETTLILNADDLISGSIAPENKRVYYSIRRMPTDTPECTNIVNDCQICPKCAATLKYEYVRYHQIGKAVCPSCGFASPKPDYDAQVNNDDGTVTIYERGVAENYKLLNNSTFNIYNQLCITALLRELGISADQVRDGLSKIALPDYRYTQFTQNGMHVVDMMAKEHNPIACSVVFDYVSKEPGMKEVLFLLDDETPKESMCWIYDCDYERLNSPLIKHIIIPGSRALDQKLRLLMAGVPEEKIIIGMEDLEAPSYLEFDGTDTVFVLHQHWKPEMDKKVVARIRELLSERGEDIGSSSNVMNSDDKAKTKEVDGRQENVPSEQGRGKIVESLFPEIANLYGDTGNVRYLWKCMPAAEFVNDSLNDVPSFVATRPDIIYMGPMSEHAQELVIDRLKKYKDRLKQLIDDNVVFLMTGNAAEVFWKAIENEDGTIIEGLGLFDYVAKRKMFARYNRHVMGVLEGSIEIVGYKNQFTHSYGDNSSEFFFDVTKGDGLNRENAKEGVRKNNFVGTYLLGPILIQNPHLTEYVLKLIGVDNPKLAFEKTIVAAYDRRLAEYKEIEFIIQ
ncbi:MAG: DUF1727 domain-containing protein [Lachnospiraceae bacterium]|nr:DUF1727 domain-containing protein [Candidatus Merdinaster equi]